MSPEDYKNTVLSMARNKRVVSAVVLSASMVWCLTSLAMWWYLRRESAKVDIEVERAQAAVSVLEGKELNTRHEVIKAHPNLTSRIKAIVKFHQYFLMIYLPLLSMSSGITSLLIMVRQAPFGRGEVAQNMAAIPNNELRPLGMYAFLQASA